MAAGAPALEALRALRALRTLRILRPSALTPVCRTGSGTITPVRALRLGTASCAGHNKWSKVKNIKGPKDNERGKIFAKLVFQIRAAVKEGGPNADFNSTLAQLVEKCKKKNMPKSTIDQAISSADKVKQVELMVEVRGPGGCSILLELLSDNPVLSRNEINRLLNKNGGMRHEGAGSFNKRGIVEVPGQNITMDRALELAIEAGAEDVQLTEDEEQQPVLQFICDVSDTKSVQTSLEELGMQIISSSLSFFPCRTLPLTPDQQNAASVLINVLNDFPEVMRVWDNIEVQS